MPPKDETVAQLDDQWRTTADIHRRVGQWALLTVRRHLGEMRRRGEIEARKVKSHPVDTYEFRKKRPPEPTMNRRPV